MAYPEKSDLVAWVNTVLGEGAAPVQRVEQLCDGVAYCRIFNACWEYDGHSATLPLRRVNLEPRGQADWRKNLQLLDDAFQREGINEVVPVDDLVQGRMQHNLHFLQWVYSFVTTYYPTVRVQCNTVGRGGPPAQSRGNESVGVVAGAIDAALNGQGGANLVHHPQQQQQQQQQWQLQQPQQYVQQPQQYVQQQKQQTRQTVQVQQTQRREAAAEAAFAAEDARAPASMPAEVSKGWLAPSAPSPEEASATPGQQHYHRHHHQQQQQQQQQQHDQWRAAQQQQQQHQTLLNGDETFAAGIETARLHGGSVWYDEDGEGDGVGTTLQGLELAAMLEEKRRTNAVASADSMPVQPQDIQRQEHQQQPPETQQQQQQQQQQPPPPLRQLQEQEHQEQQQQQAETAALLEMADRVTVTGSESLDELASKMQLVADCLEHHITEQLDKQGSAMEALTRLDPYLEHYTDKIRALQAASSLHQELELAQRIEGTIRNHAAADPLRDILM